MSKNAQVMTKICFYKDLVLYISDVCVIVEYRNGKSKCYYFTSRMKGNTKESVVRYLKRKNVI